MIRKNLDLGRSDQRELKQGQLGRLRPPALADVLHRLARSATVGEIDNIACVGILYSMKAVTLVRRRVIVAADAFVEVVIWQVSEPVPSSTHSFKYRLAYVVEQRCVLRPDNERGKGNHRHTEITEEPYSFSTPDQLMAGFEADVARWNHEHGRT